MSQSNSKITSIEKQALREMKTDFPKVKLTNNEQTTVAFVESVDTVEFSLSVASKAERKFRRKVGEYLAFVRYLQDKTVKMSKYDFYCMLDNMGIDFTRI